MKLWNRFLDWLAGREMLVWTLIPPSKPGWYWVELEHGVIEIAQLIRLRDGRVVMRKDFSTPRESNVRWWCGPIKMPVPRLTCAKREGGKQ